MDAKIAKDCYIGQNTDKKHLDEASQKFLEPGEMIIGFFHGSRRPDIIGFNLANTQREQRSRGFTLHDYMILTNKRLIMWMRGLISSNIETIAYNEINHVESHQGLLSGDIILNIHGAKERFRDMIKNDTPIAAKILRTKIDESKTLNLSSDKKEDPKIILQRRFALGEITKEQYRDMLKTLE